MDVAVGECILVANSGQIKSRLETVEKADRENRVVLVPCYQIYQYVWCARRTYERSAIKYIITRYEFAVSFATSTMRG